MNKQKLQEFFKTTYELQELKKVDLNDYSGLREVIKTQYPENESVLDNFESHYNNMGLILKEKDFNFYAKGLLNGFIFEKESKLNKLIGEMK
jgi:hypothetical protein